MPEPRTKNVTPSPDGFGASPGRLIHLQDDAQCQDLDAFLADRIHEFNVEATGYFDGRLLAGCVRNERGEIIAGFNGHTWGACCELTHLWVHERHRGQGLGKALLHSAETEALARGCVQVVLTTHSFQAPLFYERLGYERQYVIRDRPRGHSQIIFTKRLPPTNES